MKRVIFTLTLGMVALVSSGCRLPWANCMHNVRGFGRRDVHREVEVIECDPCSSGSSSYYPPGATRGEWIIQPGEGVEVVPGPTRSEPRSG